MLLLSRAVEQGLLAAILVVLARRLDPTAFAPISVLFIVYSLSVTLSDFGIGLDLLRLPVSKLMHLSSLRTMRIANLVIALTCVLVGIIVGEDVGAVIATGGVIWATSAEAYVRSSGALRRGQASRIAKADSSGMVIAALAIFILANGSSIILVTGCALASKQVIASLWFFDWRDDFSSTGQRPRPLATWTTQGLAFATANVDYLIGGLLLGPEFLSVYLVAFRLSNAAPSQVAAVTSRVAVADLAAENGAARGPVYSRLMLGVGAVGLLAAVGTALLAPLLPLILGDSWKSVAPVAVVLAAAVPARLLIGIAGALMLSINRVKSLAILESGRLIGTAGLLIIGGLVGPAGFVVASAASVIVGSAILHRVGTSKARLGMPRWLVLSSAVLLCVAGACGMLIR